MIHEPRILFVYDGCYNIDNGVSTYINNVGDYLEGQSCEANFLVGQNRTSDPRARVIGKTVTVATNGTKLELPLPVPNREIWKALEDLEPDVLHVQAPYAPTMAARVVEAADPQTKVVGTFHSLASTQAVRLATRIGGFLNRDSLNRFDNFYSVSEAAASTAKKLYGLETELLPCPINFAEYKNGRRLPEYDDGKLNVLFLGRLEERKGCAQLLEAMSLLDEGLKQNTRLIVAGDGCNRDKLQNLAERLGLTDAVEFIGLYKGSRPDLLASADIACFPSLMGESFGIVLAEAMAAGAPVIAGANEGYSETLGYDSEVLFDPHSALELASKLEGLLRNADKREEIKLRQQLQVRNFDIATKIGPRLMSAYGFTGAGSRA